jgi:WD40 repeat protein
VSPLLHSQQMESTLFQGQMTRLSECGMHRQESLSQIHLKATQTSVTSVAFSADGKYIVSGSWDKTIRMWDAQTGKLVSDPFEGHTNSVTSVAFSADGKYIVSGSWDKTIRMWDAQTGKLVSDPFEGHTN